jgi:hypothetical protein
MHTLNKITIQIISCQRDRMSEFVYFIVGRPDGYRQDEYILRVGLSDNVRETRVALESSGWIDLKTRAVYSVKEQSGKSVAKVAELAAKKFELTAIKHGWYRVKKVDLDAFLEALDADATLSYFQESKAKAGKRSTKPAEVKSSSRDDDEPKNRKKKDADTLEVAPDAKPKSSDAKPKSSDAKPKSSDAKPKHSDVPASDAKSKPSDASASNVKSKPSEVKSKPSDAKSKPSDAKTPNKKSSDKKSETKSDKSSEDDKPARDKKKDDLDWD